MTETDSLQAAQAERDRFAFENAELRSQVGRLKTQVASEQRAREEERLAKEEALRQLDTTTKAWKSTHYTKEALTKLADLDQADIAMIHIARREEVEQELVRVLEEKMTVERALQNLIARIDRDGGHRQAEDPSLLDSAERADKVVADLYVRVDLVKSRDGVLTLVRSLLPSLTDDERVEFFAAADEGFCPACGRVLLGKLDFCQCENDE